MGLKPSVVRDGRRLPVPSMIVGEFRAGPRSSGRRGRIRRGRRMGPGGGAGGGGVERQRETANLERDAVGDRPRGRDDSAVESEGRRRPGGNQLPGVASSAEAAFLVGDVGLIQPDVAGRAAADAHQAAGQTNHADRVGGWALNLESGGFRHSGASSVRRAGGPIILKARDWSLSIQPTWGHSFKLVRRTDPTRRPANGCRPRPGHWRRGRPKRVQWSSGRR